VQADRGSFRPALATAAETTSRIAATTLLASVEPCAAARPPRALFGHHAARQRGAMFRTSRLPAPRPLGPPRCSSAWSRVQNQPSSPPRALFGHHAARQRGAVFRTSPRPHHALSSATTLLVSVEPCSEPALVPTTRSLRPPRCSSAWSHVHNQPPARPASYRATTLLVSVEPCSEPAACPPRVLPGHHAARQRGAMFTTSRLPAPRPIGPPRCSSAWSHVQNQPPARPASSRATTLLVSVEPCSEPALVPTTRSLRPPRCSSAWSHVHNQPPARPTASSILNTAPR